MPRLHKEAGDRAHASPPNANQMYAHRFDRTLPGDPVAVKSSRTRKIGYDFIKVDRRKAERRQLFSGIARPGRVMAIRFRTRERENWVTAETRNIGVGGALIAATDVVPVGTAISLELVLPGSGRMFVLPAVVRWTSDREGMGVQFVGVDVDVLLELNEYFTSLEPIAAGA